VNARAALRDRLGLIVIADAEVLPASGLVEVISLALQAGAPAVQLRAKNLTARETVALGRALAEPTRRAGALFFVNDRVDIALALEADGAHLGDDDIPLAAARRIVPPGFILGRSVDNAEEAKTAEADGADYVGLGPVFATYSKSGLGEPIGPAGVEEVVAAVDLPVVGIGGIDADNAGEVLGAGAAGVAMIRAVLAAPDPAATVRAIRAAIARHRLADS
jgi:thiamine-phosphate pyrophosphorylase